MWKAQIGHEVRLGGEKNPKDAGDEWETDPDFVNETGEIESRWGAKTVAGSGHQGALRLDQLRQEAIESDQHGKEKQYQAGPRASEGYGGKFGVQKENMDKSAVAFDHHENVPKHASQQDYSKGFGGKFGVQEDRKDKSAVGWEHRENLAQHESQKDYSKGFGGKFGVQADRQDKSAVGWEHKDQLAHHESQTDYTKGFGGKFGVQSDRQDKSAVGWDYNDKTMPHESQVDHSKGFGGKFGVQADRQDKNAVGYEYQAGLAVHESQQDYSKGFGGKFGVQDDRKDQSAVGWDEPESDRRPAQPPKQPPPTLEKGRATNLRSKFEQLATNQSTVDQKALNEQQERRRLADKAQQDAEREKEEHRQRKLKESQPTKEVVTPTEEDQPRQPPKQPVGAVSVMPMPKVAPPPARVRTPTPPSAEEDEQAYEEEAPEADRYEPIVSQPHQAHAPSHAADDRRVSSGLYEELPHAGQVHHPLQESDTYEAVADRQSAHQGAHGAHVAGHHQTAGHDVDEHPLALPAHPMADTGMTAVAIYDYEATDVDEISFEPDDLVTNIEQIDAGWWRGQCKGKYGLFPANYVELRK